MKAYADLDLDITRSGGRCRVRVLRSPAGETPNVEFVPPFSRDELQALVPSLTGARRDIKARRKGSIQDLFRDAGRRLFKAVFADDIRACLLESMTASKGKVLRIRLHLGDPELAGWPWEYLVDHRLDRWLALLPELSIVRYSEMPEAVEPLEVALPLHVLVVAAARTGRRPLAADREWTHIEDGLSSLRESGQVVLDHLKDASFAALREKLRRGRWHVLHFIGHGGLDRQGEGTLLFEEENGKPEEVSGRDLGALLLGHRHLRLVVLNACEGAREGREEAFSSVAQALVRSRIPAVVAMQVAVSDRAATSFARHFYRELAEGDPLDEVLTLTRQGMFSEGHKVEWGTPVLFLRAESGRIFEIAKPVDRSTPIKGVLRWTGPALALVAALVVGVLSLLRGESPALEEKTNSQPLLMTDLRCPSPPGLADLTFRFIEPGSFKMFLREKGGETLVRTVMIDEPFCIAIYEVTQGQWARVMDGRRSQDSSDKLPAVKISWDGAQAFLRRLNEINPGGQYRLPREIEWEYAARAGTETDFSFGDDADLLYKYGNCVGRGRGDGYDEMAPVGSFEPNQRGLYDVHGNVWEWVQDAGLRSKTHVKRGGAWNSHSPDCGSSGRMEISTTSNRYDTGFRIVRAPISQ